MCDCGKIKNLRYVFHHATVHMAADLKVGDVLYVGYDVEGTVDFISQPFDRSSDTVLVGRLALSKGGSAQFQLVKNGSQIDILLEQQTPIWGIKGHMRNPIKKIDSMM